MASSSGTRRLVAAVGLAVALWCAWAAPARATYGGRVTADEPQYLLSALSLWEDGDLDISDELAAERFRDFHEADLPVQTLARDDGGHISPHDPLLPVLLAPAVGLGGWLGAKLVLAAAAGALAALLCWTAITRFGVPGPVAAVVVGGFGVASPLVAYGTQVYPELPAALAVAAGVAASVRPTTGAPVRRPGHLAVVVLAVVALPWLGIKYAPVAAALALAAAWPWVRARRWRPLAVAAGVSSVAGLAYLAVHRAVWGGWTVYASGDHFAETGELSVVGVEPDYLGRAVRLHALLLDQGFGLAAWAPAFLLVVPAGAALLRRRPPGWEVLVVPFVAGWLVATFVALTMHGWWWPGRQTVVVLPCVVLAVAWWVDRARVPLWLPAGLSVFAAAAWSWLAVEAMTGRRTLIVDFEDTGFVPGRLWRSLLPDHRVTDSWTWPLTAAWLTVLTVAAVWAWRRTATTDPEAGPPSPELSPGSVAPPSTTGRAG